MTLQIKLIALLVALLALSGGCFAIYEKGDAHGTQTERAAWVIKEKQRTDAEAKVRAENDEKNRLKKLADDAKNLKDAQDHEAAIARVEEQNTILRAAIARNGGLRIARSVCDQTPATAKAPVDGGPVDPTAGTVELPKQLEEFLLAESARADKIVEQARALQKRLLEDQLQEPQ